MAIEARPACGRSSVGIVKSCATALLAFAFCLSDVGELRAQSAEKSTDSNSDSLQEIVVTGLRQSIESAEAIKKKSDNLVDSIVAEDVGKLPDNNVADALARVTGIMIRRDSGEANSVLIRGLPNIVTLLNGREVFTTFSRFIALADIPANMLQRVDTYKTVGADQIEGGIAGLIDVRMRRPFDAPAGLQLHTNIQGVYSDKSKKTDPDVGLTVSNHWGNFGALAGVSFQERHYHEERAFNVAPDYQTRCPPGSPAALAVNCGQFNTAHPAPVADFQGPFVMGYIPIPGDRRRTSANFALEWRPDAATKLYAEGFQSDYKNNFELDFFVALPFLGNGNIAGTVIPGTNQMQTLTNHNVFTIDSTQANRAHSLTRQFAIGGSHDIGNLHLSTDLSNTQSTYDWVNPIMDAGTTVPDVAVNTSAGGTAQLNYGGAGYNIKDGANFFIANWFDNFGKDSGKATDWRGDLAWTTDNTGVLKEIGAGLRWADRRAESVKSFGGAAYPFPGSPMSSLSGIDGLSEPMAGGGPNYILKQWYTPSANYLLNNTDKVRQQTACLAGLRLSNPALFALRNDPVSCARKLDPGSFFSDKEVTKAFYLQGKLAGSIGATPWSGLVGVRIVKTDQTLGGNLAQDVLGNGILVYTPITRDNSSTDVLPSANFRFNFSDQLLGRLAVSRTITRPNFPDLNPGVSLSTVVSNTTGLTGGGGNPNLKPVKSDNYDLALEWYFSRSGMLTGALFERKFNGYVQPSFGFETYGGQQYRINRPGNTGTGKLTGLEASYQQFYDRLPGMLSGLGLGLNVTIMDGTTQSLATGQDQTITGVSKLAYNIVGLYEHQGWSGRLAYNWRKHFIDSYAFATSTNPVTNVVNNYDLIVADTKQMDGGVAYKFSDHTTVTFDVVNILDTKFKDYFNDPNLYPRDTRRYDRTFQLGVRLKL
jgi:iron complex outermembrane recepter protein